MTIKHKMLCTLYRAALILVVATWGSWSFDAPAQENQSESAKQSPKNVIAAVPRSWPPQFQIDENGNPTGFAIDVIEAIAVRAGLKVTYLIKDSFADTVDALRDGEADLIPNSGIVPERMDKYAFTSPVETFVVSMFVRNDTNDINTVGDLIGRKLAVVETNVGLFMFKDRKDIDVRVYRDVRTALFELVAGQVDALIYPQPIINSLIMNAGIENRIKIVGSPLKEIRRGIQVRNDSTELLAILNKAADEYVGTPAYQDIYVKWFGKHAPFWTVKRTVWSAGGMLVVIMLGMFGWRYLSIVKFNKTIKKSQERFNDAIESISEGFVLFDENDRLVICNSRYRDFYSYSDEDAQPGVHTRALGRLDVDSGAVILDGTVDEYLDRRDNHQDLLQKPYIIYLKDGRILQTRDRKTASGGIVSTQEDVTEFRLAQAELEKYHNELEARVKERTQQLQKLSLAVEQSPNAVFITDTEGTIEYINSKFTKLTGYTVEEIIGQNPRILKSNETPRELYSDLWQTIQSGNEWRGEIKDKRKDGSHFWVYESIAPVKDENGIITHYVATHEDISKRKDAEFSVHQALEQAEVANRAKSDLMANMSHELRTPLNAVIGFSESMMEETFGPVGSDKNREYLNDIHQSGQHLLELINDILDASAIEAGALELHEENVSMTDVVDASIRLVKPRAEAGKVAVTSSLVPKMPLIYADQRRVKQVMLNLLSNAIKFTEEGGEVYVSSQLNNDGSLAVMVDDTGVGMNANEVKKALSTFGQVDSGLDRKHEGTGLGLPLTKGLIELHGGTLEVKSEKGRGTMITVTFPKERVIRNA